MRLLLRHSVADVFAYVETAVRAYRVELERLAEAECGDLLGLAGHSGVDRLGVAINEVRVEGFVVAALYELARQHRHRIVRIESGVAIVAHHGFGWPGDILKTCGVYGRQVAVLEEWQVE